MQCCIALYYGSERQWRMRVQALLKSVCKFKVVCISLNSSSEGGGWLNLCYKSRCHINNGYRVFLNIFGWIVIVKIVFGVWIIGKKAEVNTGLANGSGHVKPSTFIYAIKETTDLRLIILVVTIRWVFDFSHMALFCNISTSLYCCSILADVGSDTLQKFELGDVPVVDDSITLANSCSSCYDCLLVIMEFLKHGIHFGAYLIRNFRCMCKILKVHQ